MIEAAFAGSWTPASSITIWFEPCLRISGSATPSLSTRWRMIETERSSAAVKLLALRRLGLQDDLEATLQVEPERDLLVDRRSGNAERSHSRQGGEDEADEDQMRTAVRHSRRAGSLAFVTS